MQIGLAMAAVAFFTALGYWRNSSIPFFAAAGCSLMVAFQFYDQFDNDFALGISMMFLLWAIACLGYGIKMLLPDAPREH